MENSTPPVKIKLYSKYFLIVFFVLVFLAAFFGSQLLYKEYKKVNGDNSLLAYLKGKIAGSANSNCLYESRLIEGKEIPLKVDGDIEFIDNETLIIKSPKDCPKQFTIQAKAGVPGRPVTKVYSLAIPLSDEKVQEIYDKGVESQPAFYIGDRYLLDRGENEKSIKDRGALPDLHASGKQYSTKNAWVVFNWFNEVYYWNDYVYLNQIFFNEK